MRGVKCEQPSSPIPTACDRSHLICSASSTPRACKTRVRSPHALHVLPQKFMDYLRYLLFGYPFARSDGDWTIYL